MYLASRHVREDYRRSLLGAVVAGHEAQLREAENFLGPAGIRASNYAIRKIGRQFTAAMKGDSELNKELEAIFELPPSKANADRYIHKLLDALGVHLWQAIAEVAAVHDRT